MRDVLENLKKLPPKCWAVVEGNPVCIFRGTREPTPAFVATDQVDQLNLKHGVSPQQVQAMIVGVTLGWDKDGADPDTHAEDLGEKPGPFFYEFLGLVEVKIAISAHADQEARRIADDTVSNLASTLNDEVNDWPRITAFAVGDTLDLIETDDPHV